MMDKLKSFFFSEKGDVVPHRVDDEFLLRFLRARFFKVNNAYKLVSFWVKIILFISSFFVC